MAAILIETLVGNAGDAIQAVLADWAAYVPNVTWTFAVNYLNSNNKRSIESVTNDTVNVTTRRYNCNDIAQGSFHSVCYVTSLPGVMDVSPPPLLPVYGARNTLTDYTNNFWANFKLIAANWMNCSRLDNTNITLANSPTGFVQTQFSSIHHSNGQIGFVTGRLTTRDAATATTASPVTNPTIRGSGVLAQVNQLPGQGATWERIATALEQIVLSRIDVSLNHGGQIYSATTQTAP